MLIIDCVIQGDCYFLYNKKFKNTMYVDLILIILLRKNLNKNQITIMLNVSKHAPLLLTS